MPAPETPSAPCRLCGETRQLQESHILPAFVFRWLKETSATGHLRFSQQPNLRAQDGLKLPFLCAACECRLNQWETQFANHVFYPLTQGGPDGTPYGPWFLLFCASVSWRVLAHEFLDGRNIRHVPNSLMPRVARAERTWREFLLGRIARPEGHEHHFLPLGPIESHTFSDMPPNMNRYFLRAVQMEIVSGERTAFTYAKLGPFAILGFISMPASSRWVGTRVFGGQGRTRRPDYIIPSTFVDYVFEKAGRLAAMYDKMSDKQAEKIEEAYRANMERAAQSGSIEAMSHDVRLFDRKAFTG
jgi:hypothetical protein